MILTGDRFYPNAENLLSILILQFVLFMHVFHLLYFVSNDNNKDVQSVIIVLLSEARRPFRWLRHYTNRIMGTGKCDPISFFYCKLLQESIYYPSDIYELYLATFNPFEELFMPAIQIPKTGIVGVCSSLSIVKMC